MDVFNLTHEFFHYRNTESSDFKLIKIIIHIRIIYIIWVKSFSFIFHHNLKLSCLRFYFNFNYFFFIIFMSMLYDICAGFIH